MEKKAFFFTLLLTGYFYSDQIQSNEMDEACGTYGERRGVYRVLVDKYEGKRPFGRPRRKRDRGRGLD
jgi:hypothetical protein